MTPSLVGFQDGLDKTQALGLDPRFGDGGDADRAEPIPRSRGRPTLPGGVLHLSLDDDAVPGVVPEDECRSEPAARREGKGDAGVGIVALDVFADGGFMSGT